MLKQLICFMALLLVSLTTAARTPSDLQTESSADIPQSALEGINQFWLQQYPHQDPAAGGAGIITAVTDPTLPRKKLAQAVNDGCYYGIGDPQNGVNSPPCPSDGEEKVNGSYVWGMDKLGRKLWWVPLPTHSVPWLLTQVCRN